MTSEAKDSGTLRANPWISSLCRAAKRRKPRRFEDPTAVDGSALINQGVIQRRTDPPMAALGGFPGALGDDRADVDPKMGMGPESMV